MENIFSYRELWTNLRGSQILYRLMDEGVLDIATLEALLVSRLSKACGGYAELLEAIANNFVLWIDFTVVLFSGQIFLLTIRVANTVNACGQLLNVFIAEASKEILFVFQNKGALERAMICGHANPTVCGVVHCRQNVKALEQG